MREQSGDAWSTTERDLRDQLRACRDAGTVAAVVTVADVEGSAYRRPGAKMLVPTDGTEAIGAVTAGCLEGPVRNTATDVVAEGTPRLEVFDLMDDGDSWGLGLGCNGIIDLLVEPLDASLDGALAALADGDTVTVVTVLDGQRTGQRTVIAADGTRQEVPEREPVPQRVLDEVADIVERLQGTGKTRPARAAVEGESVRVLVDSLQPVPEILLFGSRNDLPPLAALAADTGFRVAVHSPRGAVDDDEIPAAGRVVTGHPSTVDETVTVPEHTYAVVMSHNLVDDRIAVKTLVEETAVPYVGLMGPRERFEDLRDGLSGRSVTLTESELERVSTPVGLDLGGGEPIQIALSVVSEILAVSNGREGRRLRERDGPVHPRSTDNSG